MGRLLQSQAGAGAALTAVALLEEEEEGAQEAALQLGQALQLAQSWWETWRPPELLACMRANSRYAYATECAQDYLLAVARDTPVLLAWSQ